MACCEKCWSDAAGIAARTGQSHHEAYLALIEEREANGKICSPSEQAGVWWDEENQCDTRTAAQLQGHEATEHPEYNETKDHKEDL